MSLNKPVTYHKLHGLDHLRALAITLVVVYHYSRLFAHPEWTYNAARFGWTGVDLFFVLSGFLIASQLFREVKKSNAVSLKVFFVKRFFRIIPAYLFIVALYFFFPFLREYSAPAPLWKFLTFTQNIGLNAKFQGTFSHAWSLCIEEQFYLLFPLIIFILLRFKALRNAWILFVLLFLFSFGMRLYTWYMLVLPFAQADDFAVIWYKYIYYAPWCRTDGLVIGVAIAAIFEFKPVLKVKIERYGNLYLLIGLAILTGAYFLCYKQLSLVASLFGFPMVDVGYGFMVLGAICPTCFLYRLNPKYTGVIATLSFAIYLSHKMVIHMVQLYLVKWNITADSNTMFLACILASLLIAWLMNKLIEKPFLRLRNKVLYQHN